MNLCLGQRLDEPGWTGLPLGHFAPLGHETALPVAASQDTLFFWKAGASPASVRYRGHPQRYERGDRVIDFMAADEEAFIAHDRPEAPGEALVVAIPALARATLAESSATARSSSRFGFADPLVYEAARALERQCLEGEPLGRLFTESISTALVSYLVGKYAERPKRLEPIRRARNGTFSAAQRARLLRFIDEHLADNIGLEDMARCVNYSATHFLRIFNRTFGTSPHQFVVQSRIERAKWLLRGDRHSLADVASACGFTDQSHFTAAFARRTGSTPGRWRADGD